VLFGTLERTSLFGTSLGFLGVLSCRCGRSSGGFVFAWVAYCDILRHTATYCYLLCHYFVTILHTLHFYNLLHIWYGCRSKGSWRDCPLERPPGFQHETPRQFFFPSSRKYFFFCESIKIFQHETPVKDKREVRERFAKVFFVFAKNGRLQIKEFRSTATIRNIYIAYLYNSQFSDTYGVCM